MCFDECGVLLCNFSSNLMWCVCKFQICNEKVRFRTSDFKCQIMSNDNASSAHTERLINAMMTIDSIIIIVHEKHFTPVHVECSSEIIRPIIFPYSSSLKVES